MKGLSDQDEGVELIFPQFDPYSLADDRVVHLAAFTAPAAANDDDGAGFFFTSFKSRQRRMYR